MEVVSDAAISAEQAELLYVSDDEPGYGRRRNGRGFIYVDDQGTVIKNGTLISRFKGLRIPPAWKDVWICSRSTCHIQATGRDSRGRKQYIYHPQWNEIRNSTKFDRLIPFAQALPSIRECVDRDLKRAPFSRETVLAFVVALLEETLIRIGNREYVRQNDSYGLTTLRDYHVSISGSVLQLKFRGKRGKFHEIDIRNRRLAGLARRYQELPGQELLKYEDAPDQFKVIDSGDVNEYLGKISGKDFTGQRLPNVGRDGICRNGAVRAGPGGFGCGRKKKNFPRPQENGGKTRKHFDGLPEILRGPPDHSCLSRWYSLSSHDPF